VLERDGMICRYCGRKVHQRRTGPGKLHLDHVTPHSKGGLTTVENIVVSCRKCNLAKSDADARTLLAGTLAGI
jgi:5-methylcytosine-specific restriction endonuclease McrA